MTFIVKRTEPTSEAPVWDLPTRLFHWSVVILLGTSWWSAEQNADDLHFWSGYALTFLILFRIAWGFVGSSTARFANFVRSPWGVVAYLRDGQSRHAGHTPLGGLSVVAMILALLVQLTSGLVQIDEDDFVEGPLSGLVSYETSLAAHDLHETSFNVLLTLIALHLLAIGYYHFVRGRPLVGPMFTGRAELPEGVAPMTTAPKGRLVACAVAALAVTVAIVAAAPGVG